MKSIYTKIILTIVSFSFFSCSAGWLDLEPSNETLLENTIYNVESADVALSGVYHAIKGTSTYRYYYGAGLIYYGEVRGDDMQARTSGSRSAWAYLMNYTSSLNRHIWEEPYMVTSRANALLTAIENGYVKDADASEDNRAQLNDIKAQALVARALAHFDLLRVYARSYDIDKNGNEYGIPVITTMLESGATPGRSTVAATYNQIEADINDALSLGISSDKRAGYFNEWAAKMLLARVYLYKGSKADLEKAYKLCAEDIIPNSPYKLWTNEEYAGVWSKQGTSEEIFEIVITSTEDWVDRESIGYLYAEKGYNDVIMTESFADFVTQNYAGDVRAKVMTTSQAEKDLDPSDKIYKDKKIYTLKYPGNGTSGNTRLNNVTVMRLSEVYLIAAEAAVRLNNKKNAVEFLNPIVLRGNPSATKVTEAEVTLDRILDEKRIEFVAEGHRFFDLIRNGKQVVRYTSQENIGWHLGAVHTDARSFSPDYYKVILPIPQNEILANSVLEGQQNPKY